MLDGLDDQDESVRIAVRALGDMRSGATMSSPTSTPSLSIAPSSSTSSLASPTQDDPTSPDFVNRVSHLPFVNTALRAYEQGKARSRVVKYGAEMVESSVKSISKPVIDRLPVNQLDEFACRQLDRFGGLKRPSSSERMQTDALPDEESENAIEDTIWEKRSIRRTSDDSNDLRRRGGAKEVPKWLEATSPFVAPPPPPPDSRSPTPQPQDQQQQIGETQQEQRQQRQVVQRSRWQAVLLEAGGLSVAVSEESMRRLKYCLQWLQYATDHIDAQILILRDFIVTLQQHRSQPPNSPSSSMPTSPTSSSSTDRGSHLQTLSTLRSDIIHTIRQVVDVVSKYAGASLPEEAKKRVRGLIMCLPQRWALASGVAVSGPGATAGSAGGSAGERRGSVSVTSGAAAVAAAGSGGAVGRGPKGRRDHKRERGRGGSVSVGGEGDPSSSGKEGAVQLQSQNQVATVQAAQRILTLATESLDMMRGVTGVVKDSLDRAETWVGRLRVVGLQSTASEGSSGTAIGSESEYEYEARRRDGESGYTTPSTGTSSSKTITRTNTNTTATSEEWSVPSTPGEPNDVDVGSPGGDGAVVVSGIGELSLEIGGMKERERKMEVEVVGMDVDA